MILLVFISLAWSLLSVSAKINSYVIHPPFIEIDNNDVITDPEMLYNKYMNYKDAQLALQSILGSINNLNNVSFGKIRPVQEQADKVTDTRQNHIMIDNFGYVVRYKTDRNPDNDSFDRERRDIPVLRSGLNVTQSSDRQQKTPTSAGYTHDPDTCKTYNKNLQELWTTLSKYIESDNTMPHKFHLHNIALIIKAYFEHHNEKPEKEIPVKSYDKIEIEKIVNELIEDIRNIIASYRNSNVITEINDLVLTKLKPTTNNDIFCKITDEESLHEVIDLAHQKYLEDVDCRERKVDLFDLTRTARHPIEDKRKILLPYYSKRTNDKHRIMRRPKAMIRAAYDDYRKFNKKPIGPRSDNPNEFYNEMLKLYEEEHEISNGVRGCQSRALKTFLNSMKFIIERFIRKSECGPNKNTPVPLIIDENVKGKTNNKMNNHDFRIPVSPGYFKTGYSIPVLKNSIKSHKLSNRGSENDINTKNTKPIYQKPKLSKFVNPYSMLLNPKAHEKTHSKEINDPDDKFTEKENYKDHINNNYAKDSLDYISHKTHKEKSDAISFQSLLDSVNVNPEIAELTYIIRDPQVIMYQPQYLVKHRIPYETYLKRYKNTHTSPNGNIQLLKAVKLLPNSSKLLYETKNIESPLRYSDTRSRKVLDIVAKAVDDLSAINKTHMTPKSLKTHSKDIYILTKVPEGNSFDLKNTKTNDTHKDVNLGETHYIDNFETADYIETKSDELFLEDEDEAKKNKSNMKPTGLDVVDKEIHTNGNGKILWNSYPINIPKYTYNGGGSIENKKQIET